jgi:hypothetical protein
MSGWENRDQVVDKLASYKLLESQILANCSNRAAAAAEDTGRAQLTREKSLESQFLANCSNRAIAAAEDTDRGTTGQLKAALVLDPRLLVQRSGRS